MIPLEQIELILNIAEKNIKEGQTWAKFKKEISTISKEVDLKKLEKIYNTFGSMIYAQIRFNTMYDSKDIRPYWMFVAILDNNTSEYCKFLNEKVFHCDDPFWEINYPPNHLGCRSRVRALTKENVEEKGLKVENIKSLKLDELGFNPQKTDIKMFIRNMLKNNL